MGRLWGLLARSRHVLLEEACQRCDQPEPIDRSLQLAGEFHWLCWQTELNWSNGTGPTRYATAPLDYIAGPRTSPPGTTRTGHLTRSAVFILADVARPARAFVVAPGRPPIEFALQPDGTVAHGPGSGPGRWGCDPAGILVLNVDRTQSSIVGNRKGLHARRRVAHGTTVGERCC